ncbi:transposase [Patescibacteria group bacterium]|nr:transposase [Patescibacteria group bacterium]MDE1946495.1 transposase [Patescibacteria group bacterium]MDE2011260.1 transposase [Patescibacteria group bacterium]MDE2233343.1 transposase [Patescibacteria group bacterium]
MKKQFSPDYKAKVALEALKGMKSPTEIAGTYGVHTTQIGFWKRRLLEGASSLFSGKMKKEFEDRDKLIEELYKVIGQRDTELEWMKKNMQRLGT